jgi:hypothetical protein
MTDYFYNPYAIPYFISFIVSMAIAILLIMKKGKDPRVQLFIVVQSSQAGISLMAAMATSSTNVDVWDIWERILNPLTAFTVASIYHFSFIYTKDIGVFEDRRIALIYALPLVYTAWAILDPASTIDRFPDTELGLFGRDYNDTYPFYWPLFRSILAIMLVVVTFNFFQMYRKAENVAVRRQALYFTLAFFFPLIGFAISILLVMYNVFLGVQLAIVALTFTGALIAYGILKHELFDIHLIVKKTFIYSLVGLSLIGLFRLIELGISWTVSATFFGGDIMARLIAAAIVASIFFPFRGQAVKLGDWLFPRLVETVRFDIDKEVEIYRRQLVHALEDGVISEKEEEGLRRLRKDLGLSDKVHDELIRELGEITEQG